MAGNSPKKIGVISMVRNDNFFVARWIKYYGAQLGHENLYLILDGHDQPLPEEHETINVIRVPHREMGRSEGDRNRARLVSSLARSLFLRYDILIAHDIDEFLVIDPALNQGFDEYFQKTIRSASLSALGLDVGQHLETELPIDSARPFLEQRGFAHVSARYTKAVVATRPLTWGSGFHRVKGKNFHIDPNLYLFHFGMVDYNNSRSKIDDQSLQKAGWQRHFDRRFELFDLILKNNSIEGDDFFTRARRRQSLYRPLFALNKPGMLNEKPIIRIPERFRSVV
ncbi:MAG: glycosyltransferase family 2 protein [Bacteroidia bacterium]|nr:MAG: glycosyltransferase family 2 protein [Bacteroidia bacterium]